MVTGQHFLVLHEVPRDTAYEVASGKDSQEFSEKDWGLFHFCIPAERSTPLYHEMGCNTEVGSLYRETQGTCAGHVMKDEQ